jgi:hypothetical protein
MITYHTPDILVRRRDNPTRTFRVSEMKQDEGGTFKCILVDVSTDRPYSFWVAEEELEVLQ